MVAPSSADGVRGRSALGSRAWVLATVLFYTAILQLGYRDAVAPLFAYSGLGYRSPDLSSYVAMIVLTGAVALSLPLRLRHASDFVLWVLFCFAGAPSILIAQYNSQIPADSRVPIAVTVALTMVIMRSGALLRPRWTPSGTPRLSSEVAWMGLVAVAVITGTALFLTSGIKVSWLSLDDVYQVRSDFAQFYVELPLLGYLVPITANVINPVILARGLLTGRWSWILLGVLGQYALYVTTGNKITLFSIPALAGLSLLMRKREDILGSRLLFAVSVTALGTMILDVVTSSTVWTSLILRRFIIVPGALTAGYVAVFTGQPKTHFADSPLRWLDSPYGHLLPSLLVGTKFVGDPTTNANASLFGHGFAAYGYAGVVIEGLALIPMLWLLDLLSQGLSMRLVALVLLMPSVALASASVFTTILTHGLLAAALVFALLPREGWLVTPRVRRKSRHRGDEG